MEEANTEQTEDRGVARSQRRWENITLRAHQKIFGVKGVLCFHNGGGGHITSFLCQNPEKRTFKKGQFYYMKIYHSEPDLKMNKRIRHDRARV